VSPNLKIPRRISIKFDSNSRLEASLNFHLKSISILKMFLWRKLLLSSNPSKPHFILICLSLGKYFLNRSSLERIEICLSSIKFQTGLNTGFDPPPRTVAGARRLETCLPYLTPATWHGHAARCMLHAPAGLESLLAGAPPADRDRTPPPPTPFHRVPPFKTR
jgi:hypothetical protein